MDGIKRSVEPVSKATELMAIINDGPALGWPSFAYKF
jgi:hypothetical protein